MAPALKTTQSELLHRRSSQSLAMGVASGLRRRVTPVPLFFERADGPYFYDVDGHCLLDYTLGWGPLILGSNHPTLNAAIVKQLSRAYAFGAQHAGEIELAELLVQSVPGVERVILSNTGTEAVQAALRLSRAHTGRDKILKFEGHYHGWLNNVLVNYQLDQPNAFTALSTCGGQPASEFADTLVLPWNDLAAVEEAFRRYPQQIACVITEPMLANAGGCMPDAGYLAGLVELCRRHGAVSIFDEVITGFRLALGGARQWFCVQPDLSVYAKALAGGFTISAVGGRAEIFRVLEDGRTSHSGTYNGNPINVAAAIATVRALAQPGTFERMHAHGLRIRAAVEASAKQHGVQLVTTGAGTVFSIHFGLLQPPRTHRDVLAADAQRSAAFRTAMLGQKVQLLPDGRWYVGAAHTDRELELAIAAIDHALKEVSGT